MGEYPDEFTCAITSFLMNDPVLLPTSNTIVDKTSII